MRVSPRRGPRNSNASRQTDNPLSRVVWGEVARQGFEQRKNLSIQRYSGGGQPDIVGKSPRRWPRVNPM
jgi:hypothetical protein